MKILVLSSHTESLFWFRMDMMKDFIKLGHKVIAIGSEPENEWKSKFQKFGIEYKQIFVERNGMNPLKDFKTLISIYQLIKLEKPNKIFAYQAKTIVYGSIAAKLNGITDFFPLIAGLGSIFRGQGFKNKVIKTVMKIEYWLALKNSKKVFFQNLDDKNEFIKYGLLKEVKAVIINGSGVNIEKFKPTELPEEPAFLFIGRLIKDKGIIEYLEACKKVKQLFPEIRCLLVGPFDTNPSALKKEDLTHYTESGIIEYFGEQKDVRPYISQCSTFILPSYHEGTPKTVLEAMSMGRSIITTDAPGCKETVVDGINGYIVKVRDIQTLYNKMIYMISNKDVYKSMGAKSSKIARTKYDVRIINQTIINEMGLNYKGE
jgi:glycosyltransferase involved in cell wall biosynthesis